MKVCFETFGCRLNKAEALQMEAEYLAKGWELAERHSQADLFVVRGCSVTARAQHECEKLIAHLRKRYPTIPIRTCGCLSTSTSSVTPPPSPPAQTTNTTPSLPTRTARAYLKAQDGCSGKCTFCIVPKFRGASVSTAFDSLLDRSKRFIDSGYHEIVVTGCNLSLYASQGKRLPELLDALAELDPNCRIRLGSLEAGPCALETVAAMAEHPNICRFLHVPVQSGSDLVLMAMKRPYKARDVVQLCTDAVKRMPNLGLGCDLMTGFPGERDIDFAATKSLLSRLAFNNAHVFPYSERPNTPAAKFDDAVPKAIRSDRAHELSAIIKDKRNRYAKSFIGKTVEIVVEHEKECSGWTDEYLSCKAKGTAPRKSIARIFVTRIHEGQLEGKIK